MTRLRGETNSTIRRSATFMRPGTSGRDKRRRQPRLHSYSQPVFAAPDHRLTCRDRQGDDLERATGGAECGEDGVWIMASSMRYASSTARPARFASAAPRLHLF